MGNSSSVGPQGPKGPQGPIGPQGPQGIPGVTTVVDGTLKNVDPSTLIPALNNVYAPLPDYQQTKTDLYNSYYNKTQSDARYPSYNAFNLLNSQVNSLNNTSSYSKIDSDNKYESKTALATDVNNIISPMLSGYEKTSSLGTDITNTVGPMLNNYVQQSSLTGQLTPYVKLTDLTNILSDYTKNTDLTNTLTGYAKTTDLSAYTKNTDLTNTLTGYAKTTDLSAYTKNTDLTNTLLGYAKTNGGTITDTSFPNKYFFGVNYFGIGGSVTGVNWINITWSIVGSSLYIGGQVNLRTTSAGAGCTVAMALPVSYNIAVGKATGSFSVLVYSNGTPLLDAGQKLESTAYGNQIGFTFWKYSNGGWNSWTNAETQINFSLMFPM
jgi:hypothetical protein